MCVCDSMTAMLFITLCVLLCSYISLSDSLESESVFFSETDRYIVRTTAGICSIVFNRFAFSALMELLSLHCVLLNFGVTENQATLFLAVLWSFGECVFSYARNLWYQS